MSATMITVRRQEKVAEYLTANGESGFWRKLERMASGEFGTSSFDPVHASSSWVRFDAVKHISAEFIADFVKHIRSEQKGKAKAFCVGEFWKGKYLLAYDIPIRQRLTKLDSVDTLVSYIESLGTQFSCFDSCLQGEHSHILHNMCGSS